MVRNILKGVYDECVSFAHGVSNVLSEELRDKGEKTIIIFESFVPQKSAITTSSTADGYMAQYPDYTKFLLESVATVAGETACEPRDVIVSCPDDTPDKVQLVVKDNNEDVWTVYINRAHNRMSIVRTNK